MRESNFVPMMLLVLIATVGLEVIFSGTSGMRVAIYNFMFIVEPILLTIVAYRYNRKMFCTRYIKIVLFLAVSSLIFYCLGLINVDLLLNSGLFTKVQMSRLTYTDFYCNVLYVIRTRELSRNVGMFCEPGLYQIVLISALYIIVFSSEKVQLKHRFIAISILTITLISTQSALGYISLLFVLMGILMEKRGVISKRIQRIVIAFFCIAGVWVIFNLSTKGTGSIVYQLLVEKVLQINSNEITTGSVRMSTIETMLKLILSNPIGYGFSYVSDYRALYAPGSVGARIFVTTAAIGIVPVACLLTHFLRRAYHYRKSNNQFWLLVFLYISIAFAQSREFYPGILVLMLLNDDRIMGQK
jgi:hypothetical protein